MVNTHLDATYCTGLRRFNRDAIPSALRAVAMEEVPLIFGVANSVSLQLSEIVGRAADRAGVCVEHWVWDQFYDGFTRSWVGRIFVTLPDRGPVHKSYSISDLEYFAYRPGDHDWKFTGWLMDSFGELEGALPGPISNVG